jgi:hypothetical protein
MGNAEWTPAVWQDEQALIKIAAAKYGLDWHFVAAIRKAEDGGPGREFGVLSVKAPTYTAQLEVCCQSVRRRLVEYDRDHQTLELHEAPDGKQVVVYGGDFIEHFAAIWAPGGAVKDPHGYHRSWCRKVSRWYVRLLALDHQVC